MAASRVQANGGRNFAGSADVSFSFSSATTTGNTIMGMVHWVSSTETLTGVSGSVCGAMTVVLNPTGGSGCRSAMFYKHNVTGGSETITATFSGTMDAAIAGHEVSGLDTAQAPEKTQINNDNFVGTGTDVITSGTAVTTTTAQYVFGGTRAQFQSGATEGTGFTIGHSSVGHLFTEDIIQGAAGSIQVKFTPGDNDGYLTGIMTFIVAGGGGGSTKPMFRGS